MCCTITIGICWIVGPVLIWLYTSYIPVSYPIVQLAGYSGSALEAYLNTPQLADLVVMFPGDFGLDLINFVPNLPAYDFWTCKTSGTANFTNMATTVSAPCTLFAPYSSYLITTTSTNFTVDGLNKACNSGSGCLGLVGNNITFLDSGSILEYDMPSITDQHQVCYQSYSNGHSYTTCYTVSTCVLLTYSPFNGVVTSSNPSAMRDVVIGVPNSGNTDPVNLSNMSYVETFNRAGYVASVVIGSLMLVFGVGFLVFGICSGCCQYDCGILSCMFEAIILTPIGACVKCADDCKKPRQTN